MMLVQVMYTKELMKRSQSIRLRYKQQAGQVKHLLLLDPTLVQQRFNQTINKKQETNIKRPNNVTKKTWEDFLIHRKNLKKPLTETALKGIKKEVSKTSISLEDALVMVQARGWQSFKSDWIEKEQKSFATTNYGEGVQKI